MANSQHVGTYEQQGTLSDNKPVYIFHKSELSWDSKKNVLLVTDTFSKFSQAFVTCNQKALTTA